MANLSSAVVVERERESRVLLADNNAHPNPASSLQNEVLRIGLNGKGWGWLDWARFGVVQLLGAIGMPHPSSTKIRTNKQKNKQTWS